MLNHDKITKQKLDICKNYLFKSKHVKQYIRVIVDTNMSQNHPFPIKKRKNNKRLHQKKKENNNKRNLKEFGFITCLV